MHTRGRSSDMYQEARYDDVPADVARELDARVTAAKHSHTANATVEKK